MSWILSFFKSVAGVCRTRPLDPAMWDLEGSRITVDIKNVVDLEKPGGAVFLKGKGLPISVLVVRRPDSGWLCVENRCTHMGRKLDAEPDGRTLRCCSVNHSTFDYEGKKVSGPAKGPIQVYNSQEVDGKLVISLN